MIQTPPPMILQVDKVDDVDGGFAYSYFVATARARRDDKLIGGTLITGAGTHGGSGAGTAYGAAMSALHAWHAHQWLTNGARRSGRRLGYLRGPTAPREILRLHQRRLRCGRQRLNQPAQRHRWQRG